MYAEAVTILIADPFETSGLDALRAAGCAVLHEPGLQDEALVDRIRACGARVLVVRSTTVTAAALEAGSLALVVRAGAGYNTIDVAAASRLGIYVANCPGKNAIAVAELTMGLILAIDRRIVDNTADLRAGRWNKKEYSKARGLAGRTLGLLGYGNIGREVARRAHACGMTVLAWSRRFVGPAGPAAPAGPGGKDDTAGVPVEIVATPHDLAARADVLSVHLALTADTRMFVNDGILSRLKPASYFINTSRAEIVDTGALVRAISERGVRAGLDVFDGEPAAGTGAFVTPIMALPAVYGTHHIGASTDQAQEAIAAETVRIILAFQRTGTVSTAVNLATRTAASHMLVVRHHDRPGVLAHVFEQLRLGGINVQETENIIFEGARAAVARINIDSSPGEAVMDAIRSGNADVIDLSLVIL